MLLLLQEDPAIVSRIQSIIRAVVRHRGWYIPRQEREDVVTDAWTSLYRTLRRPRREPIENLEAFVRRVSYCACINFVRDQRLEAPAVGVDPEADAAPEPPAGEGEDPYTRVLTRELIEELIEALDRLRAACRELILLHAFEGLTYREIAARQDRTEGALRVQMHQCLKELRAEVDEGRRLRRQRPAGGEKK